MERILLAIFLPALCWVLASCVRKLEENAAKPASDLEASVKADPLDRIVPNCCQPSQAVVDNSLPSPDPRFVQYIGVVEGQDSSQVTYSLQNHTDNPIFYNGYAHDYPQTWSMAKTGGQWTVANWDWCGTGMQQHVLAPGEKIQFERSFRRPIWPVRLDTYVYFLPGNDRTQRTRVSSNPLDLVRLK